MCQIESSPCHHERAKKKSSAKAGPDQKKKKKKTKKQVSSWAGCIWAGPKPRKSKTKQVSFWAGCIWPLDFSRAGVTWLWPSAAQAEVTRPPDWSTVDVPGAGTPCYPQVETIPASAFSPPSNLPPRGLIAIFLLVNPPVMVASSVAHSLQLQKRRQTQAMLQQEVCN